MKNDDNAVAGGTIWQIAYHSFKQSNIPPDIWCPCWSNNGWMKQGNPDPAVSDQVVWMHYMILSQGHCSYDNEQCGNHK